MKTPVRQIILLLFVLLFAGCAAVAPGGLQSGVAVEQALWRLHLIDDGEEMFTGLLMVQKDGGDGEAGRLHVVLLDSTGIKLLDGRVTGRGKMQVNSALALVAKKGLPGYLNGALQKIFFSGVGLGDCCRRGLARVCGSAMADLGHIKIARFGPFALWSVRYFIKNDMIRPITKIEFKSSGPGPDMVLESASLLFG